MRFIYSLLFALLVSSGLSASDSRALEWFINTSSGKPMPDFKGSEHPGNQVLPEFSDRIIPAIAATAYTARLVYPVYEELKSKELQLLKPYLNNLSDSIAVQIRIGITRKKPILYLSFSPFIKKKNTYYKLTSFNWDIRPVASALRTATAVNTSAAANASVLSFGKWKKISVTESGLYKLTYSDIKGMGINPDKVQIYGYGGALLNEDFSKSGYQDDLPEVAVWKDLGTDGVFNSGDFILFYAQGPVSWKYDDASFIYTRVRNHYSDKAYYFVGERSAGTKTVTQSTFTGTPTKEVTSFTDFLLHETDRVNIGESVSGNGSGRELYGEDFTSVATQVFNFEALNPDTTQKSRVQVEFIARNTGTSYCNVYYKGTSLYNFSMSSVSASDNYTFATSNKKSGYFTPKDNVIPIKLMYAKSGNLSTHRANLNYIVLNVRRLLKMVGSCMVFRDPASVGANQIAHFSIKDATAKTVVFDVTNQQGMMQVNGTLNGTVYDFAAPATTLHEYVCADLSGSFPKPTMEGTVPNQNIHGTAQVDMIILAPSEFTSYANQLAQAHVRYDNLSVMVVTPEQAYNEFSSGTPDATAYRRMMKYFYDKAATDEDQPKYLLLFGDGVYDNRLVSTMFSRTASKPNKILTFQSVESLNDNSSYVSDDYFGFLDDQEGSDISKADLDIGIGRFPVSSEEQAKIAVDKTIAYMENGIKGTWKNKVLYLADDDTNADGVDGHQFTEYSEQLANLTESSYPEFMVNKIYVEASNKVVSASGPTVPDANKHFSELLNSGLLLVNYIGHGSTAEWASERLLTTPDVKAMTNKCLPLWITATCDFTRFDAYETSGGESIFLNPNGGGVALFATTRVVYATNNQSLNSAFISNLFAKRNGSRYTLGEIMAQSKCMLGTESNKLKFILIGDPALKLSFPEYTAKITQINGKAISASVDTFQALSKVTVSGMILRKDNSWAEDFNGIVCPSVLDAKEVLTEWELSETAKKTVYERSKVLFSGKDSIVNGRFSFTFVLPKDISYSGNNGIINLYAYDESGEKEAQGSYNDFVLSGTDASASLDQTGPVMELHLNDYNFTSGDEVNETPTFLATIFDENGLNTSGNGIGHDLMLIVDDSPSLTYNLNRFYSAEIGSYSSGAVQFVLPELSAGKHHLSFKAWDVQNNSSVDTLFFVVKRGLSPSISNLSFIQQGTTNAYFIFNHDRPGVNSTINLSIFDLLGRNIWNSDWKMQAIENESDRLDWNLTDTNGRSVANGIYICKVLLTDSNGYQTTESKKIRVIAQ